MKKQDSYSSNANSNATMPVMGTLSHKEKADTLWSMYSIEDDIAIHLGRFIRQMEDPVTLQGSDPSFRSIPKNWLAGQPMEDWNALFAEPFFNELIDMLIIGLAKEDCGRAITFDDFCHKVQNLQGWFHHTPMKLNSTMRKGVGDMFIKRLKPWTGPRSDFKKGKMDKAEYMRKMRECRNSSWLSRRYKKYLKLFNEG